MRYRPRNLRDEKPEVFKNLAKYNPYIARVYDYPELLLPHPTAENFLQLWTDKKKGTGESSSSGKVHIEIGCGSGRYLIEWASKNPQDFFIGLELRYKRLVLAAKKIQKQAYLRRQMTVMRMHRPDTVIVFLIVSQHRDQPPGVHCSLNVIIRQLNNTNALEGGIK